MIVRAATDNPNIHRCRRAGFAIWVSVVLWVSTGCGDSAAGSAGDADGADTDDAAEAFESPVGDPLTWNFREPGPYRTGLRIVEHTYTSFDGPRTIPVYLFYPTFDTDGAHPTYQALFQDKETILDAAPAPRAHPDGYPVLVHSHGHRGFAGNSATLFRRLVSHGFVCVVPEHVGNTLGDTPDPRPFRIYADRPLDMKAALDWALSADPAAALAGPLDAGRIAVSGHSFGVYTMWALAGAAVDAASIRAACAAQTWPGCSEAALAVFDRPLVEPRARAVVAMAGSRSNDFFGESGYNAVRKPFLLMSGSLDNVGGAATFSSIRGPEFTWIEVAGGCHQLFGLGNSVLGAAECRALTNADGFALVNPLVLGYLRVHLFNDAAPEVRGAVTGETAYSSRVTVQHKAAAAR